MHFFGSERGLLASPTQCGTYPVECEFVPWDELLTIQHSTSFFTSPPGRTASPAPAPFAPSTAGLSRDLGQHRRAVQPASGSR